MRTDRQVRVVVALVVAVMNVAGWSHPAGGEEGEMEAKTPSWSVHAAGELLARRAASGRPWLEFLEVPALRAGIYVLAAGATDHQSPHDEDEVYYVLAGRGSLSVDGEEVTVEKGDVIYVKAKAEHRFHSIEEDLELLVFFSSTASE